MLHPESEIKNSTAVLIRTAFSVPVTENTAVFTAVFMAG
jgi:hypothetical protein